MATVQMLDSSRWLVLTTLDDVATRTSPALQEVLLEIVTDRILPGTC